MTDLTIFLVLIGVATATVAVVMLLRRFASDDVAGDTALDTETGTRWLLASAPAPVRQRLESADRRVAGGSVAVAALIVLFVAGGLVGWILTGVDDQRGFARWDSAAAEFGRDRATETSTRILEALTDLGATFALFVLMALIGVFHAVRRNDRGPLVYLIVVGVGVGLLNNGLKLMIGRERPDLAQLAGSAGSAFPSGHTAAAAACWAAMLLVVTRRRSTAVRRLAAATAIGIAAIVAATRVLLGVHWVSDVIAGLVVGWGWWLATTVVFGGRALRLGAPSQTDPQHIRARMQSGANQVPSPEETMTR